MGSFSVWHWLIVGLVILVLFGRGKISETMGDFGRGIKSFKKGVAEEDAPADAPPAPPAPPRQVTDQTGATPAEPAAPVTTSATGTGEQNKS